MSFKISGVFNTKHFYDLFTVDQSLRLQVWTQYLHLLEASYSIHVAANIESTCQRRWNIMPMKMKVWVSRLLWWCNYVATLLGCNTMALSKQLQTFWRNVLSSSRTQVPWRN